MASRPTGKKAGFDPTILLNKRQMASFQVGHADSASYKKAMGEEVFKIFKKGDNLYPVSYFYEEGEKELMGSSSKLKTEVMSNTVGAVELMPVTVAMFNRSWDDNNNGAFNDPGEMLRAITKILPDVVLKAEQDAAVNYINSGKYRHEKPAYV